MARKKLRIGFVGAGSVTRWARIPPMKADGAVELVAVADPDANQAAATMKEWGAEVPVYQDYRLMIRREKLDAVCVSTPHAHHFSQTKFALQHGLHALVEKPITIFPAHTRTLLQLAKKQGRVLHVAYQRHHHATYLFARELIARGVLGQISGVSAYITQPWNVSGGWRANRALSGGGFMMDTGSHLVAVILWMTGLRPASVSASTTDAGTTIDRNAVVQVTFRDGILGTLAFFGGTKVHDEIVSIHGTKGCLVFHQHEWKMVSALVNNEPMQIPARVKSRSPDSAFYQAIRTGRDSESQQYAVSVAELTDAAYRSAERGTSVKL